MAQKPMFVDVAKYYWFGIIGAVAGLIVLAGLIAGIAGPNAYQRGEKDAYECQGGSHVWDPASCSGVQLSTGDKWRGEVPSQLDRLNGFWSLIIFPYNTNTTGLVSDLMVEISVFGSHTNLTVDPASAVRISGPKTQQETLLCDKGNDERCWGFVVLYDDNIKYPFYAVEVALKESAGRAYVGDCSFRFAWHNYEFIEMQLTVRVLWLVVVVGAIIVYWWRMRDTDFASWTLEQQCLGVLLLSLVLLNNPFYPLEFLVPGLFFPLLDILCQVLHAAVNLLFWLIVFDHIRRNRKVQKWEKTDWLKPAVVGLYFVLTFTTFMWFVLARAEDPLFGDTARVSGLSLLFFTCALLFGGLLVWILVLLMLAVPVAMQQKHLSHRFIYVAIPTGVCLLSILGGLFFGSFGPIRRSATAFMYYSTLYNVYALVLLIGYWPVSSRFGEGSSNPSEASPIYGGAEQNPFTNSSAGIN